MYSFYSVHEQWNLHELVTKYEILTCSMKYLHVECNWSGIVGDCFSPARGTTLLPTLFTVYVSSRMSGISMRISPIG